MLSVPIKTQKVDFDPIQEMADLETMVKESTIESVPDALQIIDEASCVLEYIYGEINQQCKRGTFAERLQFAKKMNKIMGIDVKSSQLPTMLELYTSLGVSTQKEQLNLRENILYKHSVETVFIELRNMAADNAKFRTCLGVPLSHSKFVDAEQKVLELLQDKVLAKVIHPMLVRAKSRLETIQKNENGRIKFDFRFDVNSLFAKDIEFMNRVAKRHNQCVKKLKEKEAFFDNVDKAICDGMYAKLADVLNQFTLYDALYSKMCAYLHEPTTQFNESLDMVQNIFDCLAEFNRANSVVDSVSSQIEAEFEAIKNRASTPAATSVVVPAAPAVSIAPATTSKSSSDTESDEEDKATTSYSYGDEGDVSAYHPSVLFAKPLKEEQSDPLSPQMKKSITGNTPRKTILKIFEGSLKIKYENLVTLVTSLEGTENEKTGSSSRKFHFLDTDLLLHKRHKRDRAQYVDPAVIKRLKSILTSLGITPDNLNYSVQEKVAGSSIKTVM